MAWNEPGNKGKDPWGNKSNNDKGPPDLDEVFRNLSKRFGGKGDGSGTSFNSAGFMVLALIALIIWAGSGFYTVKEAERGVLLRFGEFQEEVGPGLHWKATFIDEVFRVDVESVRSIPASGSMLTSDENVVKVELDVQYRVLNAYDYLFSAVDANESLREATDSALRYVVGHNRMDDILTTGRDAIRRDTWKELELILEPYKVGLVIVDVNFLPARPPEEVKDAFDDAISAQEDEQRFIREAEAYAREIEPKARGEVQRMFQPEVTRNRLYIDAMQVVLSDTNKVLIDTKNSGNLMYLPLDKMMNQGSKNKVVETQVEHHVNSLSGSAGVNTPITSMSLDGRIPREARTRQGRE
jgi:membrane protease subunit HflK